MTAQFKMFQEGNVPQISLRLFLRNSGDMPFEKLPNHVEIIDEVDVSSVPDSQGILVMVKGEVDQGLLGKMAVVIPLRLALLETIVATAGSLYPPRLVPPVERLSRSELESMLRAQNVEIDRLRAIVANRVEWRFIEPSTPTEI
jgi:hypothetical protein